MNKRPLKTLLMQLIERDHGKNVEQLMLEAFQQHGTEKAASQAIGITQQTFNVWKYRLGLADEIDNIRQMLIENSV
ncbi:MAG: hypothetical protein GC179_24915 [Anaerolineaceae bacterium]|nr:hypothetical protein [Anaerolineaceae bacterium]